MAVSSRSSQSPSWDGFGEYLRSQRTLARLTLRQMAALTQISNPYLSQLERGLHRPSLAVMKSIADALNVSVEALLEQAGVVASHGPDTTESTEAVIRNDARLSSSQKAALLSVYRSMVQEAEAEPEGPAAEEEGNKRPTAPSAKSRSVGQPRKRPPAASPDPTAS